ncbi:pentatricopeptide repeat-containing protein 1, mitochondrial-like [Saccostrea echinata]|uniref:pentatricopeptide repeat-containing protein 1, mitochondrial-like n=1 Tax=Saccostrea echinata TaxID=191078 RepID=UPI002A813050|nr:pentatricopeptide repeat-containing protein 1, mitochondrial-like [Saccostrea echinata]
MLRYTGKFFWQGKVGGFPAIFFTRNKQDVGILIQSVNEFSDRQDFLSSNTADTSNKNNLKTVFKSKCLRESESKVRPTVGGDSGSIPGGAWEDTFGNLTKSDQETVYPALQSYYRDNDLGEDSDDECDEADRPLRVIYHKLSPEWYNKQMKKYAKEGKIEQAIDVLEVIMLKNDRIRPLPSHFYTLICLISKTGDTKKAFHFFSKMRDFGYKPIPQVFTALFDACSKSVYGKEDGFQRASKLVHTLKENNITPNQTTFNAMIKTFGMLGKSEIALHLADQNFSLYRPDDKTIANILIAAAGDEENGLALAIGIWRVARLRKIEPTVFHYMLLLRAIRCCGIGDEDKFYEMLIQTSPYEMQENLQLSLAEFQKRMEEGSQSSDDYLPGVSCPSKGTPPGSVATSQVQLRLSDMSQTDCNVLDTHSHASTVAASSLDLMVSNTEPQVSSVYIKSVNSIKTDSRNFQDILKPGEMSILNMHNIRNKYERLELLGGVSGILARMKRDRIKPNVAVFGQLFHIVETLEDEEFLFSAMEELHVSPDIDIITHAMLKRLRRFEKEEAKRLLELMQQKGLMPNIFVWKYLAFIECRNGDALRQFLDELQHKDIALTVHLMDGLMRSSYYTFGDKKYLLQLMDKLDIHPTEYFVDRVYGIIKHNKERLKRMALQKDDNSEEQREFDDFQHYFQQWLKTVPLQKS